MSRRTVRSMIRLILVTGALTALPASFGPRMLGPAITLQAYQPYYPYPCPFVSGGVDYNGDGFAEITAFWHPPTGQWSGALIPGGPGSVWGQYGDIPVPGDYNGDVATDLAVWRPSTGTWSVKCFSTMNCPGGTLTVSWGTSGDIPVPADYNQDGVTDYGVWRPTTGQWFVRSGQDLAITLVSGQVWGQYGDCPIPGRLAGSGPGALELNVWRPSNGVWYYGRGLTGTGGLSLTFGTYGDIPFSMDWDANGDGDIMVWRPSTGVWYGLAPAFAVAWGAPGDIPVPHGREGTVARALIVWRPTTATIYSCYTPSGSSCAQISSFPLGATGRVPLPGISK